MPNQWRYSPDVMSHHLLDWCSTKIYPYLHYQYDTRVHHSSETSKNVMRQYLTDPERFTDDMVTYLCGYAHTGGLRLVIITSISPSTFTAKGFRAWYTHHAGITNITNYLHSLRAILNLTYKEDIPA